MRTPTLGFLILLAMPICNLGDPPSEIDELIKQLGDRRFAQREAASKRLEEIGEPALEALRKAAATQPDPEIYRRARELLSLCTNLRPIAGTYKLGQGGHVVHPQY
jgi:HEAT repeat protein